MEIWKPADGTATNPFFKKGKKSRENYSKEVKNGSRVDIEIRLDVFENGSSPGLLINLGKGVTLGEVFALSWTGVGTGGHAGKALFQRQTGHHSQPCEPRPEITFSLRQFF